MKHIAIADLAPIYEHVCAQLGWPVDQAKLAAMREKNAEKLKELEEKILDAETNLGEQEVRDGLLAKAEYLTKLGDKEAATKAFDATESKTAGFGNKMDLVFSQIRWARSPCGDAMENSFMAAWDALACVSAHAHQGVTALGRMGCHAACVH